MVTMGEMTTTSAPSRRSVAPALVRAPFRRRTWAETGYVLLGLPLALLGFVFVVASLVLGVGLAVTFVGVPLLALGGLAARRIGALHRRVARGMLGEQVPAPRRFEPGPGLFGWLQAALRDGPSWRARGYLLLKLPLAVVAFYVVLVCWVEGLVCLVYPLWWQVSQPGPVAPGPFDDLGAVTFRASAAHHGPYLAHRRTLHVGDLVYLDTWPKALLTALCGAVLLLAAPWVVRGLVALDRRLIRTLLGRSDDAARVRELEAARAQVVDDSATTLRRIERDLHDGAQAQLATLAMTLGQAKEKLEHRPNVPFDPAGALDLVDVAHRHAKEALVELRDIARGIHPPALDVGLDAALATLVARSAVPTTLHTNLPDRPAKAIETITYYSAAELLANIAKHSRARHAAVEVVARDGTLSLTVRDDGVGGAQPGIGSGLVGLTDRARSVDGHLQVSSPPGGPTVISLELPLRA